MKKNIMFILPTLIGGGAEKTVANLSKYLIDKYNIFIVIMQDTEKKYSYMGNLIILQQNLPENKVLKLISYIKAIIKLKKIKKANNIFCSISFLVQADLINILSRINEKTIISIRNKDSALWKNKFIRKIIRFTLKKCDYVVSISKQVKDDIIENFKIKKEKIFTIYNPAIITEFGKSNKKFDKSLFFKNNTVINVGRLTEQKGQWHLIRAFTMVLKEIPNAHLIILGEGNLKQYLNELIINLNLSDSVKLLGFVDNPYDYLKNSDIFVFSSLYEGLGNSILEAMACELPIISTDCECGPREILAPNEDYKIKIKNNYELAEYGILVPVCETKMYDFNENLTKNEFILAKAIIKLLKDIKLRKKYKKSSLKRIKDFDIYNIVVQWINLIEK